MSCVRKTCIQLPYTAARLLLDSSHRRQQFSDVVIGQEDNPGKENIFYLLVVLQGYMCVMKTKQWWETGNVGTNPYY